MIFDLDSVRKRFPPLYDESMNSVLCQELERFNVLVIAIRASLKRVQRAAIGAEVMDEEIERVFDDICSGRLPSPWRTYQSVKGLSDFVADLTQRLAFFSKWVQDGKPSLYWISAFYFPQSFLTGALQNFSRAEGLAIDEVRFTFVPMKDETATVARSLCRPTAACMSTEYSWRGASGLRRTTV